MEDSWGRKINYARIAITERCNLSCIYCRPENTEQTSDTLSFSELIRIARVLINLGINRIKLTGGEPTVRHDLVDLIKAIKALPGLVNVTLTTNGLSLMKLATPLADAGLDSINVSLDSINPKEFSRITRGGDLDLVLGGLKAALNAGLSGVKVNCVPTLTTTAAEITTLAELAKDYQIHVRYIELMPMGLGHEQEYLNNTKVRDILEDRFGPLKPQPLPLGNGPASYFKASGFTGQLGFISSRSACFCERCNRLRITADGFLKTCLHLDQGQLLPLGDDQAMSEVIKKAVLTKPAKHLFGQEVEHDHRLMYRIGG